MPSTLSKELEWSGETTIINSTRPTLRADTPSTSAAIEDNTTKLDNLQSVYRKALLKRREEEEAEVPDKTKIKSLNAIIEALDDEIKEITNIKFSEMSHEAMKIAKEKNQGSGFMAQVKNAFNSIPEEIKKSTKLTEGAFKSVIAKFYDEFIKDESSTFSKFTNAVKRNIVTSIACGCVSLIINFGMFFTQLTTTGKVLNSLNLISSLTSLISNLYTVCILASVEFDLAAASDIALQALQAELITPNTDEVGDKSEPHPFMKWIPRLIGIIFSIVIGGCSLLPSTSWVAAIIKNYSTASKAGDDASKTIKSLMEDVCGISLSGDEKLIQQLKELNSTGTELLIHPNYYYFEKRDKYIELMDFPEKVDNMCRVKVDSDTHKILTMTLKTLQTTRTLVVQKIQEINSILSRGDRQTTIGLALSGQGGIGKSEVGRYICREIARKLDLSDSDIYPLDKDREGFFEVYKSEKFGLANEFCASFAKNDGFLQHANKIVSSDPFNFESAFVKHQPCRLALAIITMNDIPDLRPALTEGAIASFWSRFDRFHVSDPLVPSPEHGRREGENKHRRPDFSHLVFSNISSSDLNSHVQRDVLTNSITENVNSVIESLTCKIASKELQYLLNLKLTSKPEEIESIESRIKWLKGKFPHLNLQFSNASSGRIFTVRIEGEPDVGKTFYAERFLSPELITLLPKHKYLNIRDMEQFRELDIQTIDNETPYIILLDDVLCDATLMKYHSLVNHVHSSTIIILCSNTYADPKLSWKSSTLGRMPIIGDSMYTAPSITLKEKPGVPTGVFRRMGYAHPVIVEKLDNTTETLITRDGDCVHIRAQKGYTYYLIPGGNPNSPMSNNTITDVVINKFREFLMYSSEFTWVQSALNIADPDVLIKSDSYVNLVDMLSDPYKLAIAFGKSSSKNPDPKLIIKLAPDLMRFVEGKTFMKDWIVPKEPLDETSRKNLAEKIFSVLTRLKPSATVRVVVGQDIIECKGNVGYDGTTPDFESQQFRFLDNGSVTILTTGCVIPPEEIASFLVNGIEATSMPFLEPRTILKLKEWLVCTKESEPKASRVREEELSLNSKRSIEELMHKLKMKQIFTHPAVITVACVIGMVGIGGIGYGIYKMCTQAFGETVEGVSVTQNTGDDDDPEYTQYRNERIQAVMDGKIASFEQLMSARLGPKAEIFKSRHLWQSHNSSNQVTHAHDCDRCGKPYEHTHEMFHYKHKQQPYECPYSECDWYYGKNAFDNSNAYKAVALRPSANMVSRSNEIIRSETPMVNLAKKIRANLVRVEGANGRNYGIGMREHLIFTTNHTVNGSDSANIIMDINGKTHTFTAKVKLSSKPRDLAVLELPKQAPQFKDITNHLYNRPGDSKESEGFFVRPFEDLEIHAGIVDQHDYYSPNFLITNENFSPCSYINSYTNHRMQHVSVIFRSGDCGLPLISRDCKIMGIHIAKGEVAVAMFAQISLSDLIAVTCNSDQSVELKAVGLVHDDGSGVINNVLEEIIDNIKIGETRAGVKSSLLPGLVGYSEKANLHSNPKPSRRKLPIDGVVSTPNLVTTACISPEFVPKGVSTLPYTAPTKKYPNGAPDPMANQIIKYSAKNDWSPNQEIMDIAVSYMKITMQQRYGNNHKPLSEDSAINGLKNGKLNPLEMKTSCGTSLKIKHGITDKRPVFTNVSNCEDRPIYRFSDNAMGKETRKNMQMKFEAIMCGRPFIMLTRDNPKVELLPQEKVEQGKVRLFIECDLEDNMVLKRIFGSLVGMLHEKHANESHKIGYNTYREPTLIMNSLKSKPGIVLSTDVSAMDKNLVRELVQLVVEILCSCYTYTPKQRKAIADTLTSSFHNYRGNLYRPGRGNLSGWFLTTTLNCIAMELGAYYDFIKQYKEKFNQIPTVTTVFSEVLAAYLGDDKLQRLADWMSVEKHVANYKELNIHLTPSKAESEHPEFCSRAMYFDERESIWFAVLKHTSMTGLLHWASPGDEHVINNWSWLLFEAALHWDPEYYNKFLGDVLNAAKRLNIDPSKIRIHPRDMIRQKYAEYVRGHSNTMSFVQELTVPEDFQVDVTEHFERHPFKMETSVSMLNTYTQKTKQQPVEYMWAKEGEAHIPTWKCTAALGALTAEAVGGTKPEAKSKAAAALWEIIRIKPNNDETPTEGETEYLSKIEIRFDKISELWTGTITREMGGVPVDSVRIVRKTRQAVLRDARNLPLMGAPLLKQLVETQIEFASKLGFPEVVVWAPAWPTGPVLLKEGVRYMEIGGIPALLSKTLTPFKMSDVVGEFENHGCEVKKNVIIKRFIENVQNTDTPIQPENVQQSTVNTGLATIPQLPNPQPTLQAPILAPGSQKIVSALEGAIETDTLNPLGPPNMLPVGAIAFDLKTLAYTQFLDADQQLIITDSTPAGSVLLQLPYDPLSEWMNPYARSYVQQHERFTGALLYRLTLVGNPTFSGLIGVAWQPRKITTATVSISEMQKYSYYFVSVELPSNKILVLHDARQEKFFRKTTDIADIDERPHLVIFTAMSVVSPLREGIQVRVRIASKLSSGANGESNPFEVANPILGGTTAISRAPAQLINGPVLRVFPQMIDKKVHLYTDGSIFLNARTSSALQPRIPFSYRMGDITIPMTTNMTASQVSIRRGPRIDDYSQAQPVVDREPGPLFPESTQEEYAANYSSLNVSGWSTGLVTTRYMTSTSESKHYNSADPNTITPTLVYAVHNLDEDVYDWFAVTLRRFLDLNNQAPATNTTSIDFGNRVSWFWNTELPRILSNQHSSIRPPNGFSVEAIYSTDTNADLSTDMTVRIFGNVISSVQNPTGPGVTYARQNRLCRTEGLVSPVCWKVVTSAGVLQVAMVLFKDGTIPLTKPQLSDDPVTREGIGTTGIPVEQLNSIMPVNAVIPRMSGRMPQFPYNFVDQRLVYTNNNKVFAPSGWNTLRVTTTTPSVVLTENLVEPTTEDDPSFMATLHNITEGISPTQCLAFDLLDNLSSQRVASVRYYRNENTMLVNTGTYSSYRVLQNPFTSLTINNSAVIERSNDFPMTNIGPWLNRESEPTMVARNYVRMFKPINPQGQANAMIAAIAGGALAGIGQGVSQIGQRKHELKMQNNNFDFMRGMQGNQFDFQREMSEALFSHQSGMQGSQLGHQSDMQRNAHEHEMGLQTQLQQTQHQHEMKMDQQRFNNNMEMRAATARSRGIGVSFV